MLIRNVRLVPGGPIVHLQLDGPRISRLYGGAPDAPHAHARDVHAPHARDADAPQAHDAHAPQARDADALSASAGEGIDAMGALALPGLYDAHVHAVQWAQARRRIDLSGARSAVEAVEIMRPHAGPGLVTGFGFRDGLWPDVPHKDLLPDAPLVLVSQDLHTAWFSPAALKLIGADHETGVLREHDCYAAMAALPRPDDATVDGWVADAMRAAAARGVTGVLDFEFADNVTDWVRRAADHDLAVAVTCSIPVGRLEEAIERGLRTGTGLRPGIETGPVKMFVDGSLNTRTAYCDDPYPDAHGHGLLELAPEDLTAAMSLAYRNGLTPAVHAIGDHASAIALDAFEKVGCPGRIEHAQLLRPADFARFRRPGVIVGVQPAHAPDDRDIADAHWGGRTGRAFAYRGLLDAGAVLQIGSDAPVSPLDPWDGIASAVTRTDDDRPAWHAEQAISVAEALTAASRGRTTLKEGDPADLMIVEHLDDLRRPNVLATMRGGRLTHILPEFGQDSW